MEGKTVLELNAGSDCLAHFAAMIIIATILLDLGSRILFSALMNIPDRQS